MSYERIGYKNVKVPKSITEPKNISTAIKRGKIWLIQLARKNNGLWENFGQGVVRAISYKYINISSYTPEMNLRRIELDKFNEWVMTRGDKIFDGKV
jgi:hypothetical protein